VCVWVCVCVGVGVCVCVCVCAGGGGLFVLFFSHGVNTSCTASTLGLLLTLHLVYAFELHECSNVP
jgi:hypothetical protein